MAAVQKSACNDMHVCYPCHNVYTSCSPYKRVNINYSVKFLYRLTSNENLYFKVKRFLEIHKVTYLVWLLSKINGKFFYFMKFILSVCLYCFVNSPVYIYLHTFYNVCNTHMQRMRTRHRHTYFRKSQAFSDIGLVNMHFDGM